MMPRKFPTFGQMHRLLMKLGFAHRTYSIYGTRRHEYRHAETGCYIDFRDQPRQEMLPELQVKSIHFNLTWWGLIEDIDLFQFIANFIVSNPSYWPASCPVPGTSIRSGPSKATGVRRVTNGRRSRKRSMKSGEK